MSILESVPVIGGLIDKLSNGIDELVTSDEERGKIDIEKNQIELKRLTAELKEQDHRKQIVTLGIDIRRPADPNPGADLALA